jgi:hypothetical protein
MPHQTISPETPIRQDSPVTTSNETNLDHLANDAASRAAEREQLYDQEHDIFTN